MPTTDAIILALLTGIGFGFFVAMLGGVSHQRLALILVGYFIFATLAQQLLRAFQGRDVSDELLYVSVVRGLFFLTAVGTLAIINRRWR